VLADMSVEFEDGKNGCWTCPHFCPTLGQLRLCPNEGEA
jgi:hypothetical protein